MYTGSINEPAREHVHWGSVNFKHSTVGEKLPCLNFAIYVVTCTCTCTLAGSMNS